MNTCWTDIALWVLFEFKTPRATAGRITEKYRNSVVEIVFCMVFLPMMPSLKSSR